MVCLRNKIVSTLHKGDIRDDDNVDDDDDDDDDNIITTTTVATIIITVNYIKC
jgi:hypothetical protein